MSKATDTSQDAGGTDELIEFLSLRMFPEKLTASAQSVVVAGARKAELDAYLAGVAEYEGELRALSPETLMQLIEDEKQRDAVAVQEEAERLESERFFNKPTARAYYRSWVERNYWTLDEATALILGKDPKVVNWDSIDPLVHKSPFARRYETLRRQFLRARFDGMLYEPLVPADFLRYAKSVGFALPVELDRLLRSDDEEQARLHRQAMDAMKLAELKKAIELAAEPPAPEPVVEHAAEQAEENAAEQTDFEEQFQTDAPDESVEADDDVVPDEAAATETDSAVNAPVLGAMTEDGYPGLAELTATMENTSDEPAPEVDPVDAADTETESEIEPDMDSAQAPVEESFDYIRDADAAETPAELALSDDEQDDAALIVVEAGQDELDADTGSENDRVINGAYKEAADFDDGLPADETLMNGEATEHTGVAGDESETGAAPDEWYFPDEGRKIDFEADRQALLNIFVAMAVGRYGHEPGPARDATIADIVRDHRKLELSCNEDVIRQLLQEASGYDPSDDV